MSVLHDASADYDQDQDDEPAVVTIGGGIGKPPEPAVRWPMIGPPSGA